MRWDPESLPLVKESINVKIKTDHISSISESCHGTKGIIVKYAAKIISEPGPTGSRAK